MLVNEYKPFSHQKFQYYTLHTIFSGKLYVFSIEEIFFRAEKI